MRSQINEIKILYDLLSKARVVGSIAPVNSFSDDPRFFEFSAKLNLTKENTDGIKDTIDATGVDFFEPEVALLKCLGESIERFSLYSYRKRNIKYINVSKWPQEVFPMSSFSPFLKEDLKVGYIKGINITDNKNIIIPAKLVYLGYKAKKNEVDYQYPLISTGAAGGFDFESTILRGIYEIIERDTFINTYLLSITVPMVDLKKIESEELSKIIISIERYNLELYVFHLTNDLAIPSFCSLLIDKTGIGLSVSVGAKAGLNIIDAIIGSISETLMIRTSMRTNALFPNENSEKEQKDVFLHEILKRGSYWWSTEKLKNLNFLLEQSPQRMNVKDFNGSKKEELNQVIKILKDRNFKIYFADITADIFKESNYRVIKVLIPGLQPIYLYENQKKFINKKRLKQVSDFFGIKNQKINKIPHPFL